MSSTTRKLVLVSIGLLAAAGCAKATAPDDATLPKHAPSRVADAAADSASKAGGNLMGAGH